MQTAVEEEEEEGSETDEGAGDPLEGTPSPRLAEIPPLAFLGEDAGEPLSRKRSAEAQAVS